MKVNYVNCYNNQIFFAIYMYKQGIACIYICMYIRTSWYQVKEEKA